MNINITVFIQIVNFAIVYAMLRKLLFAPTISIIEGETRSRVSLLHLIEQQKKNIAAQEKEREQFWHEWYDYCKTQQPKPTFSLLSDMICTQKKEYIPEEPVDAHLYAEIYTMLEEKIKHVH